MWLRRHSMCVIEKVKVKPKPGLLENRTHSLRWLANINSRSFKPQRKRILNLWTSLEGDSPILISDKKLALYSISVQLKKKGRNKKEISGHLWKGICQFLISGKKLTLYSILVQQKKKGRNKKETGFENDWRWKNLTNSDPVFFSYGRRDVDRRWKKEINI